MELSLNARQEETTLLLASISREVQPDLKLVSGQELG
jgi:hypothetical protein